MQFHEKDQASQGTEADQGHRRKKRAYKKTTRRVGSMGEGEKPASTERKKPTHKRRVVKRTKADGQPTGTAPESPATAPAAAQRGDQPVSPTRAIDPDPDRRPGRKRNKEAADVVETEPKTTDSHPDIPERDIYQATRRSKANEPTTILREISGQIAANDGLRRTIIANPFSKEAKQTIDGQFPDIPQEDVIRAAVLAEPPSEYDETFRRASPAEKTAMRSHQIDSAAEMAQRLIKLVTDESKNDTDPPDVAALYTRLTEEAFGTAGQTDLPRDIRRRFRLSIVNFITDLPVINKYQRQLLEEPKKTTQALLDGESEITGDVAIEPTSLGPLIFLAPSDYDNLKHVKDKEISETTGHILNTKPPDTLPDELLGHVAVVKGQDRLSESERTTAEHELRHMIFNGFFADIFEFKAWDKLETSEDHSEQAEASRKLYTQGAKDEVVAYFREHPNNLGLSSLQVNYYQEYLDDVWSLLWKQTDRPPGERAAVYDIYARDYAQYLEQVGVYKWVADRLFETAHRQTGQGIGEGLTLDKAEALLLVTDPKNARWLAPYFGAEPEDIPQLMQDDEKRRVGEFTTAVHFITDPPLFADEDHLDFAKYIYRTNLGKLSYTSPRAILPSLLKSIKWFDDESDIIGSIDMIEFMLYRHHSDMTGEEFASIRNTLDKKIKDDKCGTFGDHPEMVYRAACLMSTIDQLFTPEGVNFQEKPFQSNFDEIMTLPDDGKPTGEQVTKLVHLLRGQKDYTWYAYFAYYDDRFKYCDLLAEQPDGVASLVEVGKSGDDFSARRAIGKLSELADRTGFLTPDMLPQINEMLDQVISDYRTEAAKDVRTSVDARLLRDKLKAK